MKTLSRISTSSATQIRDIPVPGNLSFNLNGNMITSGSNTFVYNDRNQLIRIESGAGILVSYEYNWQGLRSKKVTALRTENYYYTGDDLTYITDDTNKMKYFFTRDTSGTLLHMIDYTGATPVIYFYIKDAHGNIVALADNTGVRKVNYEYDAWGLLINVPENNVFTGNGELLRDANPFRYSGYQFDPETEFYYLKNRYYSAYIGRFITEDAVMTRNRYMYCNNNPVNFVDPSGLHSINVQQKANALNTNIPSLNNSINNTANSPSTVLGIGTSAWDLILDSLKENAIKAAQNQTFNASVAAVPKVIAKQIDEITWNVSNMKKAVGFVGEWGGPALDVVLGINALNQDKQKYSGSDLNRAQAVTYASTLASVGVGAGISAAVAAAITAAVAPAAVIVIGGLAVGVLASFAIDYGSDILKYHLTKD